MKIVLRVIRLLAFLGLPFLTLSQLPMANAQSGQCNGRPCITSGGGRLNCICGGNEVRLRIYINRKEALNSLKRGEAMFPANVRSSVLGTTGTVYLVTGDASITAQMRRGFSITNVRTINGQATITVVFR